MKILFGNRMTYIGFAAIVIAIVLVMIFKVGSRDAVELVTTTVEVGQVREIVSVSGIAEAKQSAELAFPVGGIIERVAVKEGDVVETGDILVTLDARALYADRQDAAAAVTRAVADRNELLSGPTNLARDVTTETLETKQKLLETTKFDEAQKVSNAYSTLLSSNLTAYSNDDDEDAVPPVISGTYFCEKEGVYELDIYSSGADSGYSYRLSGIESGTYTASVQQPISIGTCGLRIIFDGASNYNRTHWTIEIPNTKSSSYTTNLNAYKLAITQSESAIKNAEQALALAQADAINQNAPARSEALTRANASINQAQARLNKIDTTIADRTLRAPFSGTITDIDILPGETVTTVPIVTLLASSEFKVTARIPEIDIGKLLIGQKVEMVFDAKSDEVITGEINFISLKATEIDGVAYYEAVILMDNIPTWIRSGLNADIEVVIKEKTEYLRVPKRFVTKTETGYEVLLQKDGSTATSTIEVVLEGNDGYMAITGLKEGDILVAP